MNERILDPFGAADVFTDDTPQIEHRGGMVFLAFTALADGEKIVRIRLHMTQDVFAAMRDKVKEVSKNPAIRYESYGCAGRC